MQQSPNQLISLVIPVYNEEGNLRPLQAEIQRVTSKLPFDFEIIFVDDGSKDTSVAILDELAEKFKNIRIIQFARNFGKEAAVTAGLHATKGDAAIIMDADMQMPPKLMGDFLKKWQAGAEVVVGVFASRDMAFVRRIGAKIFYKIMDAIGHSKVKITPHATDYRLLDREVVDIFNSFTERNRITRGLIDWVGFDRDYVHFQQAPRLHGKPTYRFKDLIALAVNSFTSYSLVPLKLAGYLGIFILAVSIPLGIGLYLLRFAFGNPWDWNITATTFLAVLILGLVGIVLACLGLISLYIGNMQAESLGRPLYIARKNVKPHKTKKRPVLAEQPQYTAKNIEAAQQT
ncbi:MAG: glycosyltransferase family 2 protein [Candidatus Saccharimonadales bacterium]